MPLMTHPESGQQRIVPDRSRSSYEQRGWTLADSDTAEAPSVNDRKADWVDYAKSQGIGTGGMTKQEIIDTVGA